MTEDFILKALVLGAIRLSASPKSYFQKLAPKALGPKGFYGNSF